jgi:uncharacterized membrane protein YtjA (UPF0391 family)
LKKIIKLASFLKKELKTFLIITIISGAVAFAVIKTLPCWISEVLLFITLPLAVTFLWLFKDFYKVVRDSMKSE